MNVLRLGSFGSALGVVGDCRALAKRAVAAADDRAVMVEHVLGMIIGRDEPEALLVAEPLRGSLAVVLPPARTVLRTRWLLIGNGEERWHRVASARPDPQTVAAGLAALPASGAARLA